MTNNSQRNSIFATVIIAAVLSLLTSKVSAGPALDRLDAFFTGLKTIRADFTQTVTRARLATEDTSKGSLVIERPGKFRWYYQLPYEQLIVSNGSQVWIYDADLEQVTVKPLGDTLGNTPALLLSGDQPLERNFVVEETGGSEGLAWVSLTPRASDVSFSRVRLGFDARTLKAMVLEDNLGQMTRLDFVDVQRNVRVDPALFEFKPPEGVDVFNTME